MIYLISDIHGCYEEYRELLEKINFCDSDELYILGDIMDRGPEPIKVLQDLMFRPNVYLILGNHDYIAWKILKKFNVEITEDNVSSHLSKEDIEDYLYWIEDGGKTTMEAFRRLKSEEKIEILEYLEEASIYEEIFLNGKTYICTHGDIHGAHDGKALEEHHFSHFLFYRAKYEQRYYSDENIHVVTGHTPTMLLNKDGSAKVYEAQGHIAIDCGCVYGKRLAAYCLNNKNIVYVDAKKKYW